MGTGTEMSASSIICRTKKGRKKGRKTGRKAGVPRRIQLKKLEQKNNELLDMLNDWAKVTHSQPRVQLKELEQKTNEPINACQIFA